MLLKQNTVQKKKLDFDHKMRFKICSHKIFVELLCSNSRCLPKKPNVYLPIHSLVFTKYQLRTGYWGMAKASRVGWQPLLHSN